MKKKGVHPYDYMCSFDKFNDTKLPEKEDFHSILDDEHISHEQYNMRRKFGKHSVTSHWLIIMICILDLMFSFWLIYLKTSEALVCSTTKLTHVIISHLLECHGMLC